MECRIAQICLLFAVVVGSYAHHYGGRWGGYQEPGHRFYGSVQPRGGYGYGYHHGPPREAYIQGSIYKYGRGGQGHDSSDEEISSSDEQEQQEQDHHQYHFQVTDDHDAYGYTDAQGRVHGFLIDIMRAVCRRAHKHCYFMVDAHTHCWRTQGNKEMPGIGLLDHYYDGCLGYWQSAIRKNSFNFSLPFTRDVRASLHYKAGVEVENPTTVTGKKVGFVAGWPLSHECFEHQSGFTGNSPGKYTPVHYDNHHDMIDALSKGEVDAVVTMDGYDDAKFGIQHVDPYFSCTEAGGSLMTLYGSSVLDWWNQAFEEMEADGSFIRLCRRAERLHGEHGHVDCISH